MCKIWEYPNITEKEFHQGMVRVDVFDANTILRNEMIGSFELNLGYKIEQSQNRKT
jgi:hypothetical protein